MIHVANRVIYSTIFMKALSYIVIIKGASVYN